MTKHGARGTSPATSLCLCPPPLAAGAGGRLFAEGAEGPPAAPPLPTVPRDAQASLRWLLV